MARLPTETIHFLTLEEFAWLFASVRASPCEIWGHVNPYGRYELDTESRISILA
jgi:hypothetical protein